MEPPGSPSYDRSCVDVDWVSGACLLTPRQVWEQLGGLDDRYFMYAEDADYCRRVRAAGLRVVFSNGCRVTHFEGAGRPWIGERAVLNTTRSYVIYTRKFSGRSGELALRMLMAPAFLLRSGTYLLMATLGRDMHGREKAHAFGTAALRLAVSHWRSA
jgi:GT2 family glycosyltransferase